MVIGIDGNEANLRERVGVNEYAFQILWNLYKLQEKGENPHNLIVYLKSKPLFDLPKQRQNFRYKIIPGEKFWIIKKLMRYLWRNPDKIDVLFSPNHYTVPFLRIPRICSIMDLGYLKFSSQFTKKVFWQLKSWSAISILVSKRIISISNSTKDDIVRHYPFARNKIAVTLPGYDAARFNTEIPISDVRRVKNKYSIVDDYILYLGTLKPSKNIEGLIEAFARLRTLGSGLQLVIAGKKGWLYESIFKKAEKLGLRDTIVFTGFVLEKDKPALIKGAKVFVLPSFWEGFGLDSLCAMAAGIPVVVSNTGSLPEVVGNAGIFIDPYNVESIAEGLKEILSANPKKYNRIVAAGLLQAKEFSWEKTAKKTLEVITDATR